MAVRVWRGLLVGALVALVGLYALQPGQVTGQANAACLYYDQTGPGDLSFNDMARAGVFEAAEAFGLDVKETTAASEASFLPDLLALARSGECALIIGVGFLLFDALPEAARQAPQQKFAFVDGPSFGLPNVLGLLFREQESGAPIGALAALTAVAFDAPAVGIIAGMEIPPVWRYEAGYRFGVHWALDWYEERFGAEKSVKILSTYVGRFDDPAGGKTASEAQLAAGANSLFGIAGLTHLGAFDAVEEAGRAAGRDIGPPFAFGADASQEYTKPGFVLASGRKRVDVATFTAVQQVVEGTFAGGDLVLTIAEGAHGLSTVKDIVTFIDLAVAAGQLSEDQKDEVLAKILEARDSVPYYVWEAVFELQAAIRAGAVTLPEADTPDQIAEVRAKYP